MEMRKININDTRNGNGVNFEIPLSDDFAMNLNQNDLLENSYINEVKENSINKIINYEKYMFYPAYLDKSIVFDNGSFIDDGFVWVKPGERQYTTNDLDKYSHDVLKINFNLYLKHREHDDNNDYGAWDTSDEYYWNRWDGTTGSTPSGKIIDNNNSTKCNGDLLGCLGFTDEDVFYQKNNLKKSFLRISIYDSPYRQTQKLLYYATLFFDSNILYKKYVNLNEYTKQDENELRVYQTKYKKSDGTVVDIPDSDKITATFTCTSKNDDTACSDGFYLYLFNTVVKGGQCTQLYMKVEFNHAKYGKTVVLTNPREKDDKNYQITLDKPNFPTDYEVTVGSNQNSYVDVKKLYDDLYIPIFVRYNNEKDRYEWYIASNEQNKLEKVKAKEQDIIDINLYEPRINKLK